jgi:uncharacterized RDD family membrane protein YckC
MPLSPFLLSLPTAPALLVRRLASAFYDLVVLAGILMVAALPVVLLAQGHLGGAPGHQLFQAYLGLVVFSYFGGFWVYAGQTVGMRAWRVRVTDADGGRLTWTQAGVRFAAALVSWAILGAGFWLALWDPEGRTWHDRLSRTRLVRLP